MTIDEWLKSLGNVRPYTIEEKRYSVNLIVKEDDVLFYFSILINGCFDYAFYIGKNKVVGAYAMGGNDYPPLEPEILQWLRGERNG